MINKSALIFIAGIYLSVMPSIASVKEFTEEDNAQPKSGAYQDFRKRQQNLNEFFLGGISKAYQKASDRVQSPGFISASSIPGIAKVVGPDSGAATFRLADTIYLRWYGGKPPRVGDQYHTYSPGIVLQNIINPTDFYVRSVLAPGEPTPKDYRVAGFFYEATGDVRITKVSQGIVEALIIGMRGAVSRESELMPALPIYEKIAPIHGGIQLAAAVVSGSPPERISTTVKSFIYINRGARDGIRLGQVLESVETIKLSNPGMVAPERSLGEAVVVHVSDSYSTAMITKQFDVIRIGALLKTKQVDGSSTADAGKTIVLPQDPDDNRAAATPAPPLPLPDAKKLSELDAIEQAQDVRNLTPEERKRLDLLSKQEKVTEAANGSSPESASDELPDMPQTDNSFKEDKKQAKKDDKGKKKKKKSNDEEELNLLMMQN